MRAAIIVGRTTLRTKLCKESNNFRMQIFARSACATQMFCICIMGFVFSKYRFCFCVYIRLSSKCNIASDVFTKKALRFLMDRLEKSYDNFVEVYNYIVLSNIYLI